MPAFQGGAKGPQNIAVSLGHTIQALTDQGSPPDLATRFGDEPAESAHPFEAKLEGGDRQLGSHLVVGPAIAPAPDPFECSPAFQQPGLGADARLAGPEIGRELIQRKRGVAQQEAAENPACRAGESLRLEEHPHLLDERDPAGDARMQAVLLETGPVSLPSFSTFRQY